MSFGEFKDTAPTCDMAKYGCCEEEVVVMMCNIRQQQAPISKIPLVVLQNMRFKRAVGPLLIGENITT